MSNGRRPLSRKPEVLGRSMVSLDTGEAEARSARSQSREFGRFSARRYAASSSSYIDLHENVEVHPLLSCRRRQVVDLQFIVDADRDSCSAGERHEAFRLCAANDLVRKKDIGDSACHHRFGFANRLATDPRGAGCELAEGNGDALVGLGMWTETQADWPGSHALSQSAYVSLHRRQLDDESGGLDIAKAHAGARNHIIALRYQNEAL